MSHQYDGCLTYANDVNLLAPTRPAFAELVYICVEYATQFDTLKIHFYCSNEEVVLLGMYYYIVVNGINLLYCDTVRA